MSEKLKKVQRTFNYFGHFLVFVSAVSVCVSIPTFATLVSVPAGIASPAVELKNYVITAGIKKYKSIIQKKKKKHEKNSVVGTN